MRGWEAVAFPALTKFATVINTPLVVRVLRDVV